MTANAPYYQLRGHSYQNGLNGHSYGPPEDEEYGLSTSVAPTAPMYPDSTQSHNPMDAYDNQNSQHPPDPHLEGTHQLAELLEAANSAAGQAQVAPEPGANRSGGTGSRRTTRSSGQGLGPAYAQPLSKGKRKRASTPQKDEMETGDTGQSGENGPSPRNKRVKHSSGNPSQDPDLAESNQHRQDAPTESPEFANSSPNAFSGSVTDARAAGVHSAAALFRRPSGNTAKKYTRPPMSKLFMSLQLSPENFLHLQAQAKTYMLDPEHPERQNCVGNRGKGDTDMVKLRLFNCVRDFLSDGVGERFFGENVEKPGERDAAEAARALGEGEDVATEGRKWVWPRDGNKIVSLVTPLLRRMVTNERQRMYAIETRKGGAKKTKEGSAETGQDGEFGELRSFEGHGEMSQIQTPLDPALTPSLSLPLSSQSHPTSIVSSTHQHQQADSLSQNIHHNSTNMNSSSSMSGVPTNQDLPLYSNVLSVVLTKNNVKLLPRLEIPSASNSPYHNLSYQGLKDTVRILLERLASTQSQPQPHSTPIKTDSADPALLRGLAVAAAGLDTSESNAPGQSNSDSTVGSHPKSTPTEAISATEDAKPAVESGTAQAQPITAPPQLPQVDVRALTGSGLVLVRDADEWDAIRQQVARAVWMEGRLMVVVEVI
ncbi:hypothetical protein AOQ84DRAFT_105993 [Glonium stellatum]|uniref:Uncharacterized protein n=1 Tax=Glonium stellatum TaxID=574774 RepID=A0A8E2FAN8_9PEZI|nr:hypothetical protein AOQ84DRAFT_105993 [Glonium stellatum]